MSSKATRAEWVVATLLPRSTWRLISYGSRVGALTVRKEEALEKLVKNQKLILRRGG